VKADRIQIEQLLANLLVNACSALEGREDGWIELDAQRAGDRILLRVTDNGPGLGKAALAQLADPQAADDAGLDLAVAAVIAEAHGGRLTAANCAEGGARFELSLPAVD